MFEILTLSLLVITIIIMVFGFFIKPIIDKEKEIEQYYYEDNYEDNYEDSNYASYNENQDDFSFEGRRMPGFAKKIVAEDSAIIIYPVEDTAETSGILHLSEGDSIVLHIESDGIVLDYYKAH